MGTIFVIIIILILISIPGLMVSENEIKKRNAALDNVNRYLEEQNIKEENSIAFHRGNLCVKVDNSNELLAICNYNYDGSVELIKFSNIIDCKVFINNTAMTDSLQKTVAGGVLAGGIGMLIGAMSSKISNTITDCKVEILTNDISSPIVKIDVVPFNQTQMIGQPEPYVTKINSTDDAETYRNILSFVDEIYATCYSIINNSKKDNQPKIDKEKDLSVADEIKKFKELLDIGAITREEFDIKKKELLNQ